LLPRLGRAVRKASARYRALPEDQLHRAMTLIYTILCGSIDTPMGDRQRRVLEGIAQQRAGQAVGPEEIYSAFRAHRETLLNAVSRHFAKQPASLVKHIRRLDEFYAVVLTAYLSAQAEASQRRLLQTQERHAQFFDCVPVPCFLTNRGGRVVEVNRALVAMAGIDRRRLLGVDYRDFLRRHGAPHANVQDLALQLEQDGSVDRYPLEICGPDGVHYHLQVTLSYTRDPDSMITGIEGMLQNVTEPTHLAEEVDAQRTMLQAIFDSSPAGVIFSNMKRRVTHVNRTFWQVFSGRQQPLDLQRRPTTLVDELAGTHLRPGRFRAFVRQAWAKPGELLLARFDRVQPPYHYLLTAAPVYNAKGVIRGRLWILTDISPQVGLEQLHDDLTHMLVHDLKNPLSSIYAAVITLKAMRAEPDDGQDELLDLADNGCKSMLRMITSMLDISRLETGKLALDRGPHLLEDLLDSVLHEQGPVAQERKFLRRIDPELRERPLNVDGDLLTRVLANLISNAIKHTEADGVIKIRGSVKVDGGVRLAVRDNGEGIPPEHQKRVFDKFGQVRSRRQGVKTDTGLGLTFCKLAVEAHGGHIGLRSQVGEGSTFHLTLPAGALAERVTETEG
jgi:PAS domain S-box-containing protein